MIAIFVCTVLVFSAYMIFLIFFWNWRKNPQPYYDKKEPLVFGHRGSPTIVTENTLQSFKTALAQEVDGIELDVRMSRDGQIVIFHDKELSRLSHRNENIKDLSLAEIQCIELNRQPGQREEVYIPCLTDIVPILNHVKVLNIELKSDSFFDGHAMLKTLINFLNKYELNDMCIISSFNPMLLMRLRIARPQTVIGFLYNRNRIFHGWDNMIWIFRVRPENLHIHYSMLNHWIVRWARKKGMRINSYTINDKKVFDSVDIDGVFTDNIEYLK